jgi:phosphotransferase system enzyme I (PtsI)
MDKPAPAEPGATLKGSTPSAGRAIPRTTLLRGIGASPGISIARALVLQHETAPTYRLLVARGELTAECARFQAALRLSVRQLKEIKARIVETLGKEHGYVFDAQLLMLQDPLLVDGILSTIRRDRVNAEWAVETTLKQLAAVFDDLKDEYLRERKGDVFDVGGRLLRNLTGGGDHLRERLSGEYILVSDDIRPSDTTQLDWSQLAGLAMQAGSRTYHTAILAQSLGLPCVVGVADLMQRVEPGATLILDGSRGLVLVNPSRHALREYRRRRTEQAALGRRLLRRRHLPAATRDGRRVALQANIELPEESATAARQGAEGIGLFRSEWFVVKSGGEVPDEEEQFQIYRKLAQEMRPHPVIVRTFDIEPEQIAGERGSTQPNPVLGMRATRLLLEHKDVLKTQLRALLRARVHGNLKVMFPMVSGVEELRKARAVLEEAKEELRAAGREFDPQLACGVTLEVPSAAATADLLAREAQFLSIGTNDLIQYYLAVDRSNERVSQLYQPLHPAILRILRFVIDAGRRAEVPVAVCGEIASDPLLVVILIGLGIDELSMTAAAIPHVKDFIRKLTAREAREIAEKALELSTPDEVAEFVAGRVGDRIPEGLQRAQ